MVVAASKNELQQTEQPQITELLEAVGKANDAWANFLFFINVKTGSDVKIEYRLSGQYNLNQITSKFENVENVLKEIGQNFRYLEIIFEGDYIYAKKISKYTNQHCPQAEQTVKLHGQINEKFPAFIYATQVILAELTYSDRFDLHASFPKMIALTMFKCKSLLILKKRIAHLNDLTIHFSDARNSQNTPEILNDVDNVQNAIDIVSGMGQITKLKILNREITLKQMKQVASIRKISELDLHWIRRAGFELRVKEFLEGLQRTTLERFNLTANTAGERFIRVDPVAFHRFVNELADYLIKSAKMEDKNMITFMEGELTTTATFCLKVLSI